MLGKLPLLNRAGEENKNGKHEIKTGRSLSNYSHGQNRLFFFPPKFNVVPIKIGLESEKQIETPFPHLHRLNFIPDSSAFPPTPSSAGRQGIEGYGQSITTPLWHSSLHTLFTCSTVGPPQATVPVRKYPPTPRATVWISALVWSSSQAAGKNLLSLLLHWPGCLQGCFLTLFSSSSLPVWLFVPF